MKTVFIQNLISPYRSHFFNCLNKQDNSFKVYYLSKTEADRNWDLNKIPINHDLWIDKFGFYKKVPGFHIHINPILVLKTLFSTKINNIILCVAYCDISIMTLVLAKKLHLTTKRYFFWAEANYLTNGARNESKLKKLIRKWVFSSIDGGIIIPGKMSEITFEKWEIPVKNYIYLPNTINDKSLQFNANNNRENNTRPIFLIPIRIIESLKGALNFFNAIGSDNIRKALFIIAGDGEDKEKYQEYILEHNYSDYIKLAGFCEAERMCELYNNSNVLLLPSFSDPSPLTLVEALKFHLPILCSNHCGNHFEVVKEGINGYTFSPLDKADIRAKFELIINNRSEWNKMGEISASIYNKYFETNKVVHNFITQFNKLKK